MNKEKLIAAIDTTNQAAKILNQKTIENSLDVLKSKLIKSEYLLPFMGQYSAGKSKFINTILGRDILPTNTNETTAVLTYIKYGVDEYAEVHYIDGTKEYISLEDVLKLDNSAINDNILNIVKMEVFVNNDLLKEGLTIVDTPGVNTTIQTHIAITEKLLEESLYLVYVLRGPIDAYDCDMIDKFNAIRTPVIYVRTHIDEIKPEEESCESVVIREKKYIEDYTSMSVNFFALSAHSDFIKSDLGKQRLNAFTQFLANDFITSMEKNYRASIEARLKIISDSLKGIVDVRLDELKSAANTTATERAKARKVLEKALNELTEQVEKINIEFTESKDREVKSINGQLVSELNKLKHTLNRKLKELRPSNNTADEANEIYAQMLGTASNRLTETAESQLLTLIRKYQNEIETQVINVHTTLQECGINMQCVFDYNAVAEYDNQINDLLSRAEDISSHLVAVSQLSDNELAEIGAERKQIEESIRELEVATDEMQKTLYEFDSKCPTKYRHIKGELAGKLSKIGKVCDIAMIAMPSTAWTKAGSYLTKTSATLISKGGTLSKLGGKALKITAAGAQKMSTIAKYKDMTDVANNLPQIFDTLNQRERLYKQYGNQALLMLKEADQRNASGLSELNADCENPTTVFDYLSLSYWFGKVGEFIEPDRYEIDQEYEARREEARKAIRDGIRQNVALIEENRKLITKSKNDERERKKQDFLCKMQKEEENRKIAAKEKILREQRDSKMLKITIETIEKSFSDNLEKYLNVLCDRCKYEVERLMTAIMRKLDASVYNEIEEKKERLQQFDNDQSGLDIAMEIEKFMALDKSLKGIDC